MRLNAFLLGVIATLSLIAGLYFMKFWRRTGDTLFFAFGIAFLVEAVNRTAILQQAYPNEGSPLNYLVRLFAFLIILAAILRKNYWVSR